MYFVNINIEIVRISIMFMLSAGLRSDCLYVNEKQENRNL